MQRGTFNLMNSGKNQDFLAGAAGAGAAPGAAGLAPAAGAAATAGGAAGAAATKGPGSAQAGVATGALVGLPLALAVL